MVQFSALAWLRGTLEVHNEMDEMRSEYESVKLVPKVTLRELFLNPALRIPLFISLMIMLAQQFSGINAVMFFSTRIFEMASLDESRAQQATLAVGAMNVFMTFVSLVMVEKAGRKTLLLIGFGGMIFDTFLLGVCLLYAVSNFDSIWITHSFASRCRSYGSIPKELQYSRFCFSNSKQKIKNRDVKMSLLFDKINQSWNEKLMNSKHNSK